MNQPVSKHDNDEQIEYWNGDAGQGWVDRDKQMEKSLGIFGDLVIEAANIQVDEKVLDIGCGCAATSFKILDQVGPTGRVLGVDISAPMLAVAKDKTSKLSDDQRSAITFKQADASTFSFEEGVYDLLFSRFGVMFFSGPADAFANMRKSLKPGGRLTFLCWGPVKENQWITLPLNAALKHAPPPEPSPPNAPGPFGFSNPDYIQEVLNKAGFSNINIEAVYPKMMLGQDQKKEQIADFFLEVGPVASITADCDQTLIDKVRESIHEAIMPHYNGQTVNLKTSCWVVTASNG